jgi:GntR family transcriptional regulator, galactonate operon transcriptional repressor
VAPSSIEFDDGGFLAEAEVTHSRRGLHGQVVDILGQRIISGELSPGAVVEPDRLVAELQVSRTVVREVIKVLTAKGLLDARPRTGTFVLPRSRWNLLDADVIKWRNKGQLDARLLVELEEVRQIIEPWGARLAAQRRTAQDTVALDEAFAQLADSAEAPDDGGIRSARVADADVQFHRAILAAAQNELLERLEALLEPALRARDLAMKHDHHGNAFVASHRRVLECIKGQQPDEAYQAMSDLLRQAAADSVNLPRHTSDTDAVTPSGQPRPALHPEPGSS